MSKVDQFRVLCLPVTGSSGMHAFLDATLLYKLFLQPLQCPVEHGVGLMAECQGSIGHFFVVPLHEKRLIVFHTVVLFAEVLHTFKSWMLACP